MPDTRYNRSRPTHVYKLHEGLPVKLERVPETVLPDIFVEYDDTGWEPRLGSLYKLIECTTVDTRHLPGLGRLWFDDNGKLDDAPVRNPVATAFYHAVYETRDPIVGHAVLVLCPEAGTAEEAELVISETLRTVLAQRAMFAAGRAYREGATAESALEAAREAHADEDYETAAVMYAVAAHVYQGDPERADDGDRARKGFNASVDNLVAHAQTFGEGW